MEERNLNNITGLLHNWIAATQINDVGPGVNMRSKESSYISSKTYNNMNILYNGYVEYARTLLKYSKIDEYVLILYRNQSSIENHFS